MGQHHRATDGKPPTSAQVRRCPDCGMAMTFGYLTSRRPGVRFHEHGELFGDPWGVKVTRGIRHRVDAHRCAGCGLLIVPPRP